MQRNIFISGTKTVVFAPSVTGSVCLPKCGRFFWDSVQSRNLSPENCNSAGGQCDHGLYPLFRLHENQAARGLYTGSALHDQAQMAWICHIARIWPPSLSPCLWLSDFTNFSLSLSLYSTFDIPTVLDILSVRYL